ncbi:hypothetical protein QQF64_035183 [Cirrhinus molitorella]|uniref:Uncharacterized protein n=1 Tax=Cirrhinus molitorella TaxID=172907 RepID=A0ABR3NFV5_9TELE
MTCQVSVEVALEGDSELVCTWCYRELIEVDNLMAVDTMNTDHVKQEAWELETVAFSESSTPIIFHPVLLSLVETESERTLHHSPSAIIIIYLEGDEEEGVRTHQTLLCGWKEREEATCRFSQISSADGFSQGELTQFAWAFITGTTRSRLTKQH